MNGKFKQYFCEQHTLDKKVKIPTKIQLKPWVEKFYRSCTKTVITSQ